MWVSTRCPRIDWATRAPPRVLPRHQGAAAWTCCMHKPQHCAGRWVHLVLAAGYKIPEVLGRVLACGPTSERPVRVTRGGPPRLLAGSVVQELKSSAVWETTLSRSAVQVGVVPADRVLGVAPWGPCFGEAVRVNSRGRLVTHPPGCQGPAHAVRWT